MKIKYTGKVKDNKLYINSRKLFDKELKTLNDKDIEITITQKRKHRSHGQNRYYFGVIIFLIKNELSEQWGEVVTTDTVHELLKYNCNFIEKVNKSTGEVTLLPSTTTTLTTIQFEEYVERCRRWALSNLNLEIPLPNEQIEFDLHN